MKIKNIKEKFFYIVAIGISIFLLFFVVTLSWISFDVKSQCQKAEREYKNTCIKSLMILLKDENKGFKERNDAIWALGQFADKKALPVLKSFYTGKIPERESLYKTISQYELKKAITWCEKGNVTSWMYNSLK